MLVKTYRAKSQEEDIQIINEITKSEFSVSLKTYGDGPLQLSTDKKFKMFPRLEQEGGDIIGRQNVQRVLADLTALPAVGLTTLTTLSWFSFFLMPLFPLRLAIMELLKKLRKILSGLNRLPVLN